MSFGKDAGCFKAYDVRGRVGVDLDAAVAFGIGRAFARVMRPRSVVIGHDCRLSSPDLAAALGGGLAAEGVAVEGIGEAGTEEVYFATSHLEAGGGMAVTASHNPIDYNGIKFVGPGSRPLNGAEFAAIRDLAGSLRAAPVLTPVRTSNVRLAYARRVAAFADARHLGPLRIVLNSGNGVAGAAADAILRVLRDRGAKLTVSRLAHEPDGRFPDGVPNPLLPENRPVTAMAVRSFGADMGVAWDADFDRCFLFDETGAFVEGEYIVALLARSFLARQAGATIVHDPRVIWATRDTVAAAGGTAVESMTGHAWMKTAMRETNAVYGGEMSAHHYFRDFMFCDSGMIPWLLVAELLSKTRQPLSRLVGQMRAAFPSSGERNYRVADPEKAMLRVEQVFAPEAVTVVHRDGLSMDFGQWRLNLRQSNTESLLRLNVETRGDSTLCDRKVTEIERLIYGA